MESSGAACGRPGVSAPERAAGPPALPAALASLRPGRESWRPHPCGSVEAAQSAGPRVSALVGEWGCTVATQRRKRRRIGVLTACDPSY